MSSWETICEKTLNRKLAVWEQFLSGLFCDRTKVAYTVVLYCYHRSATLLNLQFSYIFTLLFIFLSGDLTSAIRERSRQQ